MNQRAIALLALLTPGCVGMLATPDDTGPRADARLSDAGPAADALRFDAYGADALALDAFAPGADAFEMPDAYEPPPPPDAYIPPPPPLADRIQVQVTQECREGGVKFVVLPTSPYRTRDGYSFAWNRTSGGAPFTTSGNALVVANVDPSTWSTTYPNHYDVVVSHAGYPDRVVADVWTNPCNHDDNPTDCPENNRDLVTNQESYAPGDHFDARVLSGASYHAPWYVLDGLRDVAFDEDGRHLTATVASLPIHIHAQGNSTVGSAVCHGWTERWFY